MSFKGKVSSLILFLGDLSIYVIGILGLPTVIVFLSTSPFRPVNI